MERYGKHLEFGYKSGLKKAFSTSFFAGTYNLIIFGSMSMLFWYGSNLAIYGHTSFGMVQGIFWLFTVGAIRVGQAAPTISNVMNAKMAAGELFAVIDRVPEMDCASSSGDKPTGVRGEIEFERVCFNYPSRPEVKVLESVFFKVEAGRKVALVSLPSSQYS